MRKVKIIANTVVQQYSKIRTIFVLIATNGRRREGEQSDGMGAGGVRNRLTQKWETHERLV